MSLLVKMSDDRLQPAFASSILVSHRRHPLSSISDTKPPTCCLTPRRPRQPIVAVATAPRYTISKSRPSADVSVSISRPARDVRRVNAAVLIRAPIETVWSLLSDYSQLDTHIPNLAESTVLGPLRAGARVRQCGAQTILGFTFKAAVTLDMAEIQRDDEIVRAIEFRRSANDNGDFKAFHGVWKLDAVSPSETALYYDVSVSPKGLVPVRAIEWRISEDVPANMDAVKRICESRYRSAAADARRATQR